MAAFSTKLAKKHGLRSVSFPASSHPSTLRLDEELNKRGSRH
ncbi:hypothetical protein Goarm_021004, partial [Gossypium armourianum]|nr:hypothetical protein [Gossypium armourianum]